MLRFQDKIFDMPKKPISGFALYVSERMPELIKKASVKKIPEHLKQIAKEWQEGKNVDQNVYNKIAEKDKLRFKKQLKEFNKFGYYTKTKGGDDIEDDEEEKKSRNKKRSIYKAKSIKTKRNKSYPKKINKKEKDPIMWKSKESEKVGMTQKPKK